MKKLLIILLCFPMIGFGQAITDSLLLYYPMNNFQDLSGNNFHPTSIVGVSLANDRFGVPFSSWKFEGIPIQSSMFTGDFVEIPNDSALKPDFPLTVALWVKIDTLGFKNFINTNFIENNYHGVWINMGSTGYITAGYGGGDYSLGCVASNRVAYQAYELPIDTTKWYHITVVFHSPTNIQIYIDCNTAGANFATGTGPLNIHYSASPPQFPQQTSFPYSGAGIIGAFDNNMTPGYGLRWFKGYVDELSYWNRGLTAIEVNTLCDSIPLISIFPTTWECINGTCLDPGNGTGTYSSLSACQANCVISTWECINGTCLDPGNGTGTYSSLSACQANCVISTWECINGTCLDPGNGTGIYSSLSACQANCIQSPIQEYTKNKELLKVIDILGRETKDKKNEVLFYIYDDGTVEKKIIIE